MQRILVLDTDHPLREQMTEVLRQTANTEVVITSNADELLSRVKQGPFAAVFVDGDLLDGDASRVIAAVGSSFGRPMLVIASNEKSEELDPDLVTLVVRKPYDVVTLTGVLLSAVTEVPPGRVEKDDSQTLH